VLTLDGAVEDTVAKSLRSMEGGQALVLEPRYAEQILLRLSAQVEKMVRNNQMPVLICAPGLRRHLKTFTERVLPQLSIISMAEVPAQVSLRSFSTVSV
jgi:flagellar biosynthesis protein FlhA